MTYTPECCERREYPWNPERDFRAGDYAYARARVKLPKRAKHLERGYVVAGHFAEVIGSRKQRASSSKTEANRLRRKFEALVSQWRSETRFSSSVDETVLHPAYQSIIAMGTDAVPLVLAELDANRGHWFWALHFMTGNDPVPQGSNVEDARQVWLKWGREKGLLE